MDRSELKQKIITNSYIGPARLRNINLIGSAYEDYLQRYFNQFNIALIYHENSKLKRYQKLRSSQSIALYEDPALLISTLFSNRSFPLSKRIKLPKPPNLNISLEEAIVQRKSIRHFNGPISLQSLAALLHYGTGMTFYEELEERSTGIKLRFHHRALPSGGGLYPIDVYLVALRVKRLLSGTYFYDVGNHELNEITLFDKKDLTNFLSAFPVQPTVDVGDAAAVIILVGVFWRSMAKYGIRGYRYVLQESGHLGQNLYLAATALNLGVVALGGFYDDDINQLLHLDAVEEAAVYAFAVGNPKGDEEKLYETS